MALHGHVQRNFPTLTLCLLFRRQRFFVRRGTDEPSRSSSFAGFKERGIDIGHCIVVGKLIFGSISALGQEEVLEFLSSMKNIILPIDRSP